MHGYCQKCIYYEEAVRAFELRLGRDMTWEQAMNNSHLLTTWKKFAHVHKFVQANTFQIQHKHYLSQNAEKFMITTIDIDDYSVLRVSRSANIFTHFTKI